VSFPETDPPATLFQHAPFNVRHCVAILMPDEIGEVIDVSAHDSEAV
jgi:hypothetical protein